MTFYWTTCGLALLYYSDVFKESPSGRSLHIRHTKVEIFSCWNIVSPFPKLFCAHLHVPDCIEKIRIDLALSLFCCCQGIFNHLSSIISLCIFSCKPHWKSRFPRALCLWAGQLPPQPPLRLSSLCAWYIHRSVTAFCAQQVLVLTQACGSSSEVTDLAFRLYLPFCSHLCCRPTPQTALFSSFCIRQDLESSSRGVYTALKSSVSSQSLQAMPERKGYFNPCLATGKLRHKR